MGMEFRNQDPEGTGILGGLGLVRGEKIGAGHEKNEVGGV